MSQFGALLRRELSTRLSGFKKDKRDVFGIIINILLTLGVCAVLLVVFGYFVNTYIQVKVGFESEVLKRAKEIITILVALLLIVNIIVGTFKINHYISDVKNWNSLLSLPIKKSDIFKSKLVFIYLELLATTLIVMMPFSIIFCIMADVTFLIILNAIGISLVMPFIALFICSLLALPVYFIKKAISKNYVVTAILFFVLLAGFFYIYSLLLSVLQSLLETGYIKFIFNEENINLVGSITSWLYPSNILADIMLFNNVWLNLLWVVLITGVCFAGTYFLTKYIFDLASKNKISNKKDYLNKKNNVRQKSTVLALMYKEFLSVLRTPSFSFQYFATALALPLMIYITCSLGTQLVDNLIFVDCHFEIALITVAMYSILTNTFCATNISREKKFFNLTKTIPISYKQIVLSKVAFCEIISLASIFISTVVLLVAGYINIWQGLLIFLIANILNLGIICFATRKDLNKPSFDDPNGGVAVSFVIFFGLIISAIVAILALISSLFLKMLLEPVVGELVGAGIILIFALVVLGVSILYLLKGLGKKYNRTVA